MKTTISIIATAVLFFCYTQNSANASDLPKIPLKYFKNSGLYDAYQNKTKFTEKFLRDYKIAGARPDAVLNTTSESRLKLLGSMKISEFERSGSSSTLSHAGCDPYDQVVTIPNDRTNVIMYPSCVVMKQCGGCCGHPSLTCKPTNTRPKSIEIMKYIYDGSSAHPAQSVDFVEVEEHTACQCQCKLTESDCEPALHTFDEWDCKCKCKAQRTACPTNKRWDENLCACRCSSVQNCGSGYQYNMITCSCEAMTARSGDNSNNDNRQSNDLPDTQPTEVVEVKPCAHLSCPRRYKPKLSYGRCICKFDRESFRRG